MFSYKPPSPIDQYDMSDLNVPENPEGGFVNAMARGVDSSQMALYGFAKAVGDLTGVDLVSKWADKGIEYNLRQILENPPKVHSWDDTETLADYANYILETIGEQVPQLLVDIPLVLASIPSSGGTAGVAAVGARRTALAAIGKAAKRVLGETAYTGFRKHARKALVANMYTQAAGETQLELEAEGIDSPSSALAAGIPKAMLDIWGAERLVGVARTLNVAPRDLLQVSGRAIKEAGIGFLSEGFTEAAQTAIDKIVVNAQAGEDYDLFSDANIREIKEAGIKGAIVGSVFSGARGTFEQYMDYRDQIRSDQDVESSAAASGIRDNAITPPTSTPTTTMAPETTHQATQSYEAAQTGLSEIAVAQRNEAQAAGATSIEEMTNAVEQASLGDQDLDASLMPPAPEAPAPAGAMLDGLGNRVESEPPAPEAPAPETQAPVQDTPTLYPTFDGLGDRVSPKDLTFDDPMPETQTQVDAQAKAVAEGRKPAMEITRGSPPPTPGILPPDATVAETQNGHLISLDRDLVEQFDQLGGSAMAMGSILYGNSEGKKATDGTVTIGRDSDGEVVYEEHTNKKRLATSLSNARQVAGEGGTVEIADEESAMLARADERVEEALFRFEAHQRKYGTSPKEIQSMADMFFEEYKAQPAEKRIQIAKLNLDQVLDDFFIDTTKATFLNNQAEDKPVKGFNSVENARNAALNNLDKKVSNALFELTRRVEGKKTPEELETLVNKVYEEYQALPVPDKLRMTQGILGDMVKSNFTSIFGLPANFINDAKQRAEEDIPLSEMVDDIGRADPEGNTDDNPDDTETFEIQDPNDNQQGTHDDYWDSENAGSFSSIAGESIIPKSALRHEAKHQRTPIALGERDNFFSSEKEAKEYAGRLSDEDKNTTYAVTPEQIGEDDKPFFQVISNAAPVGPDGYIEPTPTLPDLQNKNAFETPKDAREYAAELNKTAPKGVTYQLVERAQWDKRAGQNLVSPRRKYDEDGHITYQIERVEDTSSPEGDPAVTSENGDIIGRRESDYVDDSLNAAYESGLSRRQKMGAMRNKIAKLKREKKPTSKLEAELKNLEDSMITIRNENTGEIIEASAYDLTSGGKTLLQAEQTSKRDKIDNQFHVDGFLRMMASLQNTGWYVLSRKGEPMTTFPRKLIVHYGKDPTVNPVRVSDVYKAKPSRIIEKGVENRDFGGRRKRVTKAPFDDEPMALHFEMYLRKNDIALNGDAIQHAMDAYYAFFDAEKKYAKAVDDRAAYEKAQAALPEKERDGYPGNKPKRRKVAAPKRDESSVLEQYLKAVQKLIEKAMRGEKVENTAAANLFFRMRKNAEEKGIPMIELPAFISIFRTTLHTWVGDLRAYADKPDASSKDTKPTATNKKHVIQQERNKNLETSEKRVRTDGRNESDLLFNRIDEGDASVVTKLEDSKKIPFGNKAIKEAFLQFLEKVTPKVRRNTVSVFDESQNGRNGYVNTFSRSVAAALKNALNTGDGTTKTGSKLSSDLPLPDGLAPFINQFYKFLSDTNQELGTDKENRKIIGQFAKSLREEIRAWIKDGKSHTNAKPVNNTGLDNSDMGYTKNEDYDNIEVQAREAELDAAHREEEFGYDGQRQAYRGVYGRTESFIPPMVTVGEIGRVDNEGKLTKGFNKIRVMASKVFGPMHANNLAQFAADIHKELGLEFPIDIGYSTREDVEALFLSGVIDNDMREKIHNQNKNYKAAFIPLHGKALILLKPDTGKNKTLAPIEELYWQLGHEIGHAVKYFSYANTPKALRAILNFQHARDAKHVERYRAKDGFEEWYADKIAASATKRFANRARAEHKRAKNLKDRRVQNYFDKLGEKFVSLFNKMRQWVKDSGNQRFVPNKAFDRFMEYGIKKKVFRNANTFGEERFYYMDNSAGITPTQDNRSRWQRYGDDLLGPSRTLAKGQNKIKRPWITGGVELHHIDKELGDTFARKPGTTLEGKRDIIPQTGIQWAKWKAGIERIFKKHSTAKMAVGLKQLSSQLPTDQLNAAAKDVRAYLNEFHKKELSKIPDIGFIEDYYFRNYSKPDIRSRRSEFVDMLKRHFARTGKLNSDVEQTVASELITSKILEDPVTLDDLRGLTEEQAKHVKEILDDMGSLKASDDTVKPGEGTLRLDRKLNDPELSKELTEGGFINKNPMGELFSYLLQSVRRVQFETAFGGYKEWTDQDGNQQRKWNADLQLKMKIAQQRALYDNHLREKGYIEETSEVKTMPSTGHIMFRNVGGPWVTVAPKPGEMTPYQADRVVTIIKGFYGQNGQKMDPKLRSMQSSVMAMTNWVTLSLSGVAQLVESANILAGVRNFGDLDIAWKAIKGMFENRAEMIEAYEDLGMAEHNAAAQALSEVFGYENLNAFAETSNRWLFKLNGNEFLVKMFRTVSIHMGMQFFTRHAKRAKEGNAQSKRYLDEFGVTADEVQTWDALGRPILKIEKVGIDPDFEVKDKMFDALHRWTDSVVARPNRTERPVYGNDPRYAMLMHLKPFSFHLHYNVFSRIMTESKTRWGEDKGDALMYMGSVAAIFFAMAAMANELREEIQYSLFGEYRPSDHMSGGEYVSHLLMNRIGLGSHITPWSDALFNTHDQSLGMFGLVPAVSVADNALNEPDLFSASLKITPIVAQNYGMQKYLKKQWYGEDPAPRKQTKDQRREDRLKRVLERG